MQRPWGVEESDLFKEEEGGQEIVGSRVWYAAICICGGEYGFYSKQNKKLFESFKQASDMI